MFYKLLFRFLLLQCDYFDLTANVITTATEQLWVSDITYLRTENGFVYLSLITDAYSRKIVGYHVSQYLKAQGCIIALDKAISQLSTQKEKKKTHSSFRSWYPVLL